MKRVFFGSPLSEYLPALGLFVLTVIYLITGYQYAPQARVFPVAVAWVALVLLALDIVSRTKTPAGEAITRWLNPAAATKHTEYALSKQLVAALWPPAFVVLIMLIGFLYAVPIYVMASMYFRGRLKLWLCVVVSAAATAAIWLMFVQMLELELYPGILFSEF